MSKTTRLRGGGGDWGKSAKCWGLSPKARVGAEDESLIAPSRRVVFSVITCRTCNTYFSDSKNFRICWQFSLALN